MSSLLLFNTRDSETDTPYDTFWPIHVSRLNNLTRFKITLQNIEFPNVVYPINRFNNNLYFSEDDAGSFTATLTPNGYTGTQLAAELKTQLEAAGAGTYTVTYDTQSKKMTIAVAGAVAAFQFLTGVNNAYGELGYELTSASDADAASYTSDYPINISGSAYVDVVTNFSTHNHSVSTTSNVFARVPLADSFGSVVLYEPHTDDSLFVNATEIGFFNMHLRDDKGNVWELPKNAHVSLALKITAQ